MLGEDDSSKDPDTLFCLSLVEGLRNLNARKKAFAKMELQRVLFEVEFDDSRALQDLGERQPAVFTNNFPGHRQHHHAPAPAAAVGINPDNHNGYASSAPAVFVRNPNCTHPSYAS
jgi:hypothetical protein